MDTSWRRALALAAALAAAAPAEAAERGAILLRFAWPERLAGQRVEKVGRRAAGDVTRKHALRVERRGEETWLHASPADAAEEQAAADRQDDPELPLVVGADGRIARLEGLEAWAEEQAAFQVSFAADAAEAQAAKAAARARAERLAVDARELWAYQVEAWAGRTVEVGRTTETTARAPVPAVPGLEVEQQVVLSARRWTSCTPGGIDQRCLELTLRAEAGSDAFRRALAKAGGKAARGFEEGLLTVEVVLVAEPETLLPWRFSITSRQRLVFAGRGLSVDQVERREREYRWWKG